MGVEGRVGGMVGGPPIIRRDIASTPPPPRRHACPEPLNVGFVCVTVCRFAEAIVPTFPSGPSDTMQLPITAIRTSVHAPSLFLSTSNVFVRSLRLGAWGVSFSQPV